METHLEEDIDADVVRIRPTCRDVSVILVFIPGNPGLITFYLEFLNCIHKKNPSWDIVGIGHSGMSSLRDDGLHTEAVYTLEEQIYHKVRAINRIVGEDSKRHVIVVGHSIGAYMAQKIVLHGDLKVKVDAVDLLTPTIVDIHRSRKGAQLTRINYWFPRFHEYVSMADKLLLRWVVPPSWLDWLARKVVGGCDECVLKSAGQLVTNPNFIKQSLGLAQFEMHQVRNEWEFQDKFIFCSQENRIRVRFLFSANDYWVHTHTMKDIIEFYETKYNGKSEDLLTISVGEEISHSFVLKDTVKVVDILY